MMSLILLNRSNSFGKEQQWSEGVSTSGLDEPTRCDAALLSWDIHSYINLKWTSSVTSAYLDV